MFDSSEIQSLHSFSRSHSLGLLQSSRLRKESYADEACPQLSVLIEWVFASQMHEEETSDERIGKILIFAGLLSCPKPSSFRVLDCAGIIPPRRFEDPRYGFVYSFPSDASRMNIKEPVTLRQLLSNDRLSLTLGDKFHIAKSLSNSLFELHCHGWLHKNFRSDNIIFFLPEPGEDGTSGNDSFAIINGGPYLIGFHHSRPSSEVFYSDVNSAEQDPDNTFYQHPGYRHDANRFTKRHDHYSLGMVLLEIAFWRSCHNMWQDGRYRSIDRGSFKDKLVEKFVPGLAAVMGTAYKDAVLTCLVGESEEDEEKDRDQPLSGNDDCDSWFFREVVQKLDACYVG